jgi:hypothetical protein
MDRAGISISDCKIDLVEPNPAGVHTQLSIQPAIAL